MGKDRAIKLGYYMSPEEGDPSISFQEGNAQNLSQIPDQSVDAYTIAFGIRYI